MQNTFILVILAYLSGSIPFGKIFGKLKNIDIQKEGSGNIGFANAVRVLGWRLGALVLICDVLKGFLPVYVASEYFNASLQMQMIIGLVAIIGHAFPVWLRFKGGKSIATGLGVMLVIDPILALMAVSIYVIVFSVSKKSAVGSLVGAWLLPLLAFALAPELTLYTLLLALFATYTHRNNINQLVRERYR